VAEGVAAELDSIVGVKKVGVVDDARAEYL
jgi:hypothetical protein